MVGICMDCVGLGDVIATEAVALLQVLFRGMVDIHGNIDAHGVGAIAGDVAVMIRESEFIKIAFMCGIVAGANLMKLQHRNKR